MTNANPGLDLSRRELLKLSAVHFLELVKSQRRRQ